MNKRSRKQRLVAEINITPFTDVILVLLIIFMIATPLLYQAEIQINLPESRSAKAADEAQPMAADITITREGMVYLNGKLVTQQELKEQITAMHKDNPDLSVTVRSDKYVRLQEIVGVIDPLTEIGISKLGIATLNEQEILGE